MQGGKRTKGAMTRVSMLVIALAVIIIIIAAALLSGVFVYKSIGPVTCTGLNCAPTLFGTNVSTDCVSVGQPLYPTAQKVNVSDFTKNSLFYSCTFTYNEGTGMLTVSCPHSIGSYSGNTLNFPVVLCSSKTTSVGSTSVTSTTYSSSTTTTGSGSSSSSSTSTATTTTGSSSTTTVGYAYIASYGYGNGNNNTISVVDVPTNTVVKTIPVGGHSWGGIAESPTADLLYFTNYYNNTLGIINTSTNRLVGVIAVGASPDGVAFSPYGNIAYVTNRQSGNVSVINTSTGTVVKTIKVGSGPYGVAFAPDGSFAYVVNYFNSTVSVINTSTETVTGTILIGSYTAGLRPDAVAFNPSGSMAYVTLSSGDNVSVINTSTNRVIGSIAVRRGPDAIAFSPSGNIAYVTNFYNNTISAVNTSTMTVVGTIGVGPAPDAVAFPADNIAYVGDWYGSGANVIDTATSTVAKTMLIGNNTWGIAVKPPAAIAPPPKSPGTVNYECIGGSTGFSSTIKSVYSSDLSASGIGSWTPYVSLPANLSQTSCSYYNGSAYCIGGSATGSGAESDKTYYSSLHGSWSTTTSYPFNVTLASCNAYSGYIYCVGGSGGPIKGFSAVYSAPISASGIGNWSRQTPLPINYTQPECLVNGIDLFCITGNSTSSYFAPIGGGGVGTWTSTTAYPRNTSIITPSYNDRIGCAAYNGYVYCVGGDTNSTYYATISGGGIGSWKKSTLYPVAHAASEQCTAEKGYLYCATGGKAYTSPLAGANLTYYAPISSSGIGNWTAGSLYPGNGVSGASCFANVSQSLASGGVSSLVLLHPLIKVPRGSSNSTKFTLSLASGSAGPTNLNLINAGALFSSYGISSSANPSFGYPTYSGYINVTAGSTTPSGLYNLTISATGYDPSSAVKLTINVTGGAPTTTTTTSTTTTVPTGCYVCRAEPPPGVPACPSECPVQVTDGCSGLSPYMCIFGNSTSSTTSTSTTSTSTTTVTTTTITYDAHIANNTGNSDIVYPNSGDTWSFCTASAGYGFSSLSWTQYPGASGFTSDGYQSTGGACSFSALTIGSWNDIGIIGSKYITSSMIYRNFSGGCSSCERLLVKWNAPSKNSYLFVLASGDWPTSSTGGSAGVNGTTCTRLFYDTGTANNGAGGFIEGYACNPPIGTSGNVSASIPSSGGGEISISAVVVT